MRRLIVGIAIVVFVAAGCGDDDPEVIAGDAASDAAGAACPVDDPDCGDDATTSAPPLPDDAALDPLDPDAPIAISFGGYFHSDGVTSQLCSVLAESFPPQCGSTIIEIDAPIELILEHVAESFGNPDDAAIQNEQSIYWTDEWVTLAGILSEDKLVLEG